MGIAVGDFRLEATGQSGCFGRVLIHSTLTTDDQFFFRFQGGLGPGDIRQSLIEPLIELGLGTGLGSRSAGLSK